MQTFYTMVNAAVLLFIVHLLMVAPRFPRRKYSLPEGGFAHRGLWSEEEGIPENSMTAFRRAIEHGFGIETDVQLSADGVPVIMHDSTLLRMCGVDRRVSELSFSELCELRLNGTDERIPTLAELLAEVSGRVMLLIELKGETFDTELCDTIVPMLDAYAGDFVIESFNPVLLHRMKRLRPQIIRGQLMTDFMKRNETSAKVRPYLLTSLTTNILARPDFIAYDMTFPRLTSLKLLTRIFRARRCVWTVRSEAAYAHFIDHGDCPIFENFVPGENDDAEE